MPAQKLLSACRKAGHRDSIDITYVLVPTHGLASARDYMHVCILSIIYIRKHQIKQSFCFAHSNHFSACMVAMATHMCRLSKKKH